MFEIRNTLIIMILLPMLGVLAVLAVVTGCESDHSKEISQSYLDSLGTWKESRLQDVSKNWIPLAGLEWLNKSVNTFGRDSSNLIKFPTTAPPFLGSFSLNMDTLIMRIFQDTEVHLKSNGEKVAHESRIEGGEIFVSGQLEWTVIKRSGNYAVRIWDFSKEKSSDFKLHYFDPDPAWRIKARFESYTTGTTYPIVNVLGMVTETSVPGKLSFTIDGQDMALDVMEGGPDSWFVIFGDKTNGETTYEAGRYLYVPRVKDLEFTTIDFNRSYNPPCAFTAFATCPLPPRQNQLDIDVLAGELSSPGGLD